MGKEKIMNNQAQPVYVIENPNHLVNGQGAAAGGLVILFVVYKIVFWCLHLWYNAENVAIFKNENIHKIAIVEKDSDGVGLPDEMYKYHVFNNPKEVYDWKLKEGYEKFPTANPTFHSIRHAIYKQNEPNAKYHIRSVYVIYKNKNAWIRRQYMASACDWTEELELVNTADKVMPREFFLWMLHSNDLEKFKEIDVKYNAWTDAPWIASIKKQNTWVYYLSTYFSFQRWMEYFG